MTWIKALPPLSAHPNRVDAQRWWMAWPLLLWVAASVACATVGPPVPTPPPTLPAPVRWRQPTGSSVISPPALADGLLVYLSTQAQVVALDLATGGVKWQHKLDTTLDLNRPLAIANGSVVVEETLVTGLAHSQARVVGLDLHSGQMLWTASLSPLETPYFFYHPVAANGAVYFESETGPGLRRLTAADPATGGVRWQAPLTGTALAGDPTVDGGLITVPIDHVPAASSDQLTTDLLALDTATGARRWTVALGSLATPILAAGAGRVFATTLDGTCWAIDSATGLVSWKFKFDDHQPGPPRLADNTLYFGDGQGRLYALDAASGALRWQTPLGRGIQRRPVVGGGQVYVGSDDGNLNALEAATGRLLWRTQNPWQHPFASNPYIPPMNTEPVLASGTLVYFNVDDLIALAVP